MNDKSLSFCKRRSVVLVFSCVDALSVLNPKETGLFIYKQLVSFNIQTGSEIRQEDPLDLSI
jgi:hypothetical protein